MSVPDRKQADDSTRGDPRAPQASSRSGISSGSVNDAPGAAGNLAGGEGDAYPTGPGADSGMLQGVMTGPETPDASMGGDQVLGSRTMTAADTPMPANEAAAEVEKRGIARDPIDERQGGESHA
jgi:hypothetical protein